MKVSLVTIGAMAVAVGALSCSGSGTQTNASSPATAATDLKKRTLPVPNPIPGGDIIPASPPFHPEDGPIHQFLPGPNFDGEWAEPNGMTDFFGTVAQVYLGGSATDQTGRSYLVEVDTRVYQGAFIDTAGKLSHGTFCEIWFDFYDPSSGSQLHDFSPGNGENLVPPVTDPIFHLPGLFWMVRIDDDQFKLDEDGRSATLDVENVLEFDRFQFLGPGNVPSHLTFHIGYQRGGGPPTVIRPTSTDPLSQFNWAGVMWNASATGTFSVAYDDGSFSATGTLDSASTQTTYGIVLPFGHFGYEANGVFAGQRH